MNSPSASSADASPFAAAGGGVLVRVRLTPKASANRVMGVQSGADGAAVLKVQVTAVPEAGKANAALVKLLSKAWRLPKSAISVQAGATDRNKILRVEGEPAALIEHLKRWMEETHG